MSKKSKKKRKLVEKQTPVTRKFLLELASDIYNPKKKTFMNLCRGTLQNGPDPKDKKRPMHCGLGELYYRMTGLQPNQTGVEEDSIAEMATDRCTLIAQNNAAFSRAVGDIKKLNLPKALKDTLIQTTEQLYENENELNDNKINEFRDIIRDVPDENDVVDDDTPANEEEKKPGVCTPTTYKKRAILVAAEFRRAAALLPA